MSETLDGDHSGEQYSSLFLIIVLNKVSIVVSLRSLNTLRTQAEIFLAASHIMLMCAVHETSGVMFTPRSRTSDDGSMV